MRGMGSSRHAWAAWASKSMWYATATRPAAPSPSGYEFLAGSSVRTSDAERSKVADSLSQHYAEGRLDEQEFGERLHAAMSARTRGELAPLLADLPDLHAAPAAPGPPHRAIRRREVASQAAAFTLLLAVGVAGLVVLTETSHLVTGLVLLLAAAYLGRRFRRARAWRLWHAHLHEHGSAHWHGPRGPVPLEPDPRKMRPPFRR